VFVSPSGKRLRLFARFSPPLLMGLACGGCGLGRGPSTTEAGPAADLVLRGGAVYTVDAARSWASAIAVRDGRIAYVGTDSLPSGMVGPKTEVIELAGQMVLPGFQDAHVHPLDSGVELGGCNLDDLATPTQIVDTIRAYAGAHPELKWVRGTGWQLPVFPGGNPSKALLDQAVPDRPAFFYAADGHSAWVNSKALALAKITRDTPDPANGRIERDRRTHEPSGTLREEAVELVADLLPERSDAELTAGLQRAEREASAFGITTVFEADAGEPELKTYAAADRAGKLSFRVVAASHVGEAAGDSVITRLQEWRKRYSTQHVHPIAAKIFADGVIESRTAALLAPYLDRPGDSGSPNYDSLTLTRLAVDLDRAGFQIHVHAIGDRAIRMTLDALEQARRMNGVRDSRHGIAHLELIDPADIPRFRRLGVIANFQPLWANGDEYLTKLTEPALGPARSRWLYPMASVARTGAVLVAGSDWSVSSLNPLDGIEVGITHRQPDFPRQKPWNPAERLDLATMIAMYTINAAYANHRDRETGSIEVGKLADLVVLDRNLFAIAPEQIHYARVVRTLLEGKTVYQRGGRELSAIRYHLSSVSC
jgi:predicted amidohydrolase YtcJ